MQFLRLAAAAAGFLLIYAALRTIVAATYNVQLILSASLLYFICNLRRQSSSEKEINTENKAVLITGCDTGFGNLLARKLDAKGFQVFASCLLPDGTGAKELIKVCSDRLKIVPLDVSNDESVANAFKFVKENLGANVFWAVVNNAGIAKGSSVDFSTITHFKDTIDVNALGPVRMSQAFLPLLKKSKGRIVNVNSVLGRFPMTFSCPYTMSKYASVAFTECLNLEMSVWGVRVISIEPETFRTGITNCKNVMNRIMAELKEIDESTIASYGEEYLENMEKMISMMSNWSSDNINIVVDAMVSAVTNENPDVVYKPRWSLFSKFLCSFMENIPFSIYEKIFNMVSKQTKHPVPKGAVN